MRRHEGTGSMPSRRRILFVLVTMLLVATAASWIRSLWRFEGVWRHSVSVEERRGNATSPTSWLTTHRGLWLGHSGGRLRICKSLVQYRYEACPQPGSIRSGTTTEVFSLPLSGTNRQWPWSQCTSWDDWV